MKPVAFDYVRPASVGEAVALLAANAGCKGSGRRPDARPDAQPAPRPAGAAGRHHAHRRAGGRARGRPTRSRIGATVTHAAIEDGRVPDPTGGFLARVARGIAYRAVRTRGTIGGSLAHADPAADWLSCLTALGAEVLVRGAQGARGACPRAASCAAPWRPSLPTTSWWSASASRNSRQRRPLRLSQDLPQDRRVRRGDRRCRATIRTATVFRLVASTTSGRRRSCWRIAALERRCGRHCGSAWREGRPRRRCLRDERARRRPAAGRSRGMRRHDQHRAHGQRHDRCAPT